MSEQLSFSFASGDNPARRRPPKAEYLFFAVFPPRATAHSALEIGGAVARASGIARPLFPPERLHVSLVGVNRTDRLRSIDLHAAKLAAESVAMAPFDMIFDRIGSFRTPKRGSDDNPLLLIGGGAELVALMEGLAAGLRDCGLRRGFERPHLTLLYDKILIAEQAITPVRWTVRDFRLVHSERGLTNYIEKGRWPLRAARSTAARSAGRRPASAQASRSAGS